VLFQVGFVVPARIDLEGTQRVQAAFLECDGAAWPVDERLAFLHVLEGEPGLLDEHALRVDMVRLEALLLGGRFVRAVLGMMLDFQPASNF
jgi:hypothetical protein